MKLRRSKAATGASRRSRRSICGARRRARRAGGRQRRRQDDAAAGLSGVQPHRRRVRYEGADISGCAAQRGSRWGSCRCPRAGRCSARCRWRTTCGSAPRARVAESAASSSACTRCSRCCASGDSAGRNAFGRPAADARDRPCADGAAQAAAARRAEHGARAAPGRGNLRLRAGLSAPADDLPGRPERARRACHRRSRLRAGNRAHDPRGPRGGHPGRSPGAGSLSGALKGAGGIDVGQVDRAASKSMMRF